MHYVILPKEEWSSTEDQLKMELQFLKPMRADRHGQKAMLALALKLLRADISFEFSHSQSIAALFSHL